MSQVAIVARVTVKEGKTFARAVTGTCLRLMLWGSRVPHATLHAVPRGAWRGCCIGLGIDGRLRLGEMEARRQMRRHHESRASPAMGGVIAVAGAAGSATASGRRAPPVPGHYLVAPPR